MYILVTICAVTFPEVQRCGFGFFFCCVGWGGEWRLVLLTKAIEYSAGNS